MPCVVRDELNRKIAILQKEWDPDNTALEGRARDKLAIARNDELQNLIHVRSAHVQNCPDCHG
jgi:hypothetical protein